LVFPNNFQWNSEFLIPFYRQERPRNKALNKERPAMQIYRPGMGKFSSQTITGKSDEGPEFATEFAGGNSADESRSDSKQPDGNTGKNFQKKQKL
jgi:hypothetical protein